MPKWKVHRYFSNKLGISPDIAEKVDRIIDLEKEFKGYKIGHDWIKGNIGKFTLAVELFYQEFGIDGVKAMLLHGALDYADQLLRCGFSDEEVLWRVIAWIKFCGASHMINRISKLARDKRLDFVMRQDFSYYNYLRLTDIPLESIIKASKEVIQFFIRDFDEIMRIIHNPDIL